MRAISLWQPWASAIALGLKRYETRHWSTDYRGPLAIHAARKSTRELEDFFNDLMLRGDMWPTFQAARLYSFTMLPKGGIVAIAILIDVLPTERLTKRGAVSDSERVLGNFAPGRFAWQLRNIHPLPQPYYIKGRQGFFNVPDCYLPSCPLREGMLL